MIISSKGRLHKTNGIISISRGIHGYNYCYFGDGFQKNKCEIPSLFRTLNL